MRTVFSLLIMFILEFLCCNGFAEDNKQTVIAPIFNNLGQFHYPITTKIPLAQNYFDQGLVLYYGFEWGESIRSFKAATKLDPGCAMCFWGLALALKAKINAPMNGHELLDAKFAIQKSLLLSSNTTPIEKDYINALALRFHHTQNEPLRKNGFSCHLSRTRPTAISKNDTQAYLTAMKKIADAYPRDHEAKVLYAAALYWSLISHPAYSDPSVQMGIKMVKAALKQDPNNVGANHYYIHLIEPYPHANEAMASADRLNNLVPGAEHLVHMPAHIYLLTGRYHDATLANIHGINTYKKYQQDCLRQGFQPKINYLYFHDYDFLRTSAAMEGRKNLAMQAANQFKNTPFTSLLKHDPMLEWFIPIPYYIEARFGLWDQILKEPMPQHEYNYAKGMYYYARGIAYTHKNKIELAQAELTNLNNIMNAWHLNNRFGNQGFFLLSLAKEMLEASIANKKSNEEKTFSHLSNAVKIQDQMGYHEPPDWYFPVRQAVAEAYFNWGYYADSAFVYKQDLKQYPNNGWSLYGLLLSLRKSGKRLEAQQIEKKFKIAWQYADIARPISFF